MVEAWAPGVERPLNIAHDDLTHAVGQHDLGTCQAGSAGADNDDLDVRGALIDDPQCVHQRGEYHDRRSVLVVMEDGNVELGAQSPLDLKAAWRRDILQIDRAEGRHRHLGELDDAVDVLGRQAQRERIDPGELLEQQRLTLHYRYRSLGADVAQPKHRRPVRDHRHRVALDRQRPRSVEVLVDGHAHAGDARRVSHREVITSLEGDRPVHLDLATEMHQERAVRHAFHDYAI